MLRVADVARIGADLLGGLVAGLRRLGRLWNSCHQRSTRRSLSVRLPLFCLRFEVRQDVECEYRLTVE